MVYSAEIVRLKLKADSSQFEAKLRRTSEAVYRIINRAILETELAKAIFTAP